MRFRRPLRDHVLVQLSRVVQANGSDEEDDWLDQFEDDESKNDDYRSGHFRKEVKKVSEKKQALQTTPDVELFLFGQICIMCSLDCSDFTDYSCYRVVTNVFTWAWTTQLCVRF